MYFLRLCKKKHIQILAVDLFQRWNSFLESLQSTALSDAQGHERHTTLMFPARRHTDLLH